jgi:hypothetical protein
MASTSLLAWLLRARVDHPASADVPSKQEDAMTTKRTIAIDMTDRKNGTEVFIAIHDADVEITRDGRTELLAYGSSMDIYLGGLHPKVTINVYKPGEKP